MGRPPCCDKTGVKKGPWTPEEDIMLVSYVQEHGPGNWRAVPTNTGLRRCSKSCRLRWTNYLRPGIKRGSFTDHEEKMIIQLQSLLGNKWAAIASYLPERTDNDIKNYWNTHLKKKLKKIENGSGQPSGFDEIVGSSSSSNSNSVSRGQWEKRLQTDISTAKQALQDAISLFDDRNTNIISHMPDHESSGKLSSTYASSTENIARLLKNWVKTPNKEESSKCSNSSNNCLSSTMDYNGEDITNHTPGTESKDTGVDLSGAFESLFGFKSFDSSRSDDHFSRSSSSPKVKDEIGSDSSELAPLSMLENWLLDDLGKDYLAHFSFDENPNLF